MRTYSSEINFTPYQNCRQNTASDNQELLEQISLDILRGQIISDNFKKGTAN